MRVLLIEDNISLMQSTADYLSKLGHVVDCAASYSQGLHVASTSEFDVMVIDWMLPDGTGVALCESVRSQGVETHIIMLTAKGQLDDKLNGFQVGVDDYLVKPVDLPELNARIIASQRHFATELTRGPLTLCRLTRVLKFNHSEVKLNAKCHTILWELMLKCPNAVSRDHLEHKLWGEDTPESDALRAHLYTVRKVIESDGEKRLETIRGSGYRLIV